MRGWLLDPRLGLVRWKSHCDCLCNTEGRCDRTLGVPVVSTLFVGETGRFRRTRDVMIRRDSVSVLRVGGIGVGEVWLDPWKSNGRGRL